jgi:hypothetical protein
MALMYKPNPVILLADDDGTVFFSIVPSALPLTTGDLFDLRRQAEEVGLQLLVVESVAVDNMRWLEDELVRAAIRRDAAATAPRTVRGLLAKGVSYMDDLSIDLRIAHGFDDGLNEGEPFGTLTPEAMAQRLRFRLADYDRQREVATGRPGSRSGARAGAVVCPLARRSEARRPEDVRPRPGSGDGVLTRAAELANKNPVSFSALVEKYCHSTALSDAVRLLEQRTLTAG